ncbi:serine protease [Gamsiella multidivaricata]|uniref:serine protease n=1 Tax=Gamsiella multidivaricata TaxID=101098 RepID=UPI00221FCEE2|nr:serine protease [Gamsiella multidivaricata]KAI7820831.1 serine protease [Gamsiella multidivaricata]
MLLKIATASTLLLAASTVVASKQSVLHSEGLAPIISAVEAELVPDSYFVVFKDGARAQDQAVWIRELHHQNLQVNGATWVHVGNDGMTSGVKHVYDMGSFQGLAGRFSPGLLEQIRRNPNVDYIEHDQFVYASDVQVDAPWGLARISHRKPLTAKDSHRYIYDPEGGQGVVVFVIDSGINIEHEEFEGRADWGVTIPREELDLDDIGHGTHVAGTIASRAYGVAKKANVVAVKVLGWDGTGTTSDLVAGVDYSLKVHLGLQERQKEKYRGSVANMSLRSEKSRSLDGAITSAVEQGLHFVVSAGNDDEDACKFSPSGIEAAVTVGASTVGDRRAVFSNHGPCVDVFAPGTDVESAWVGSKVAKQKASGTSMASPHVAGLVAYYLSLAPESESGFFSGRISPKEMKELLKETATKGMLKGLNSKTPNLLVYNGRKTTTTDDEKIE